MKRLWLMAGLICCGVLCHSAMARADEIRLNGHTFTVPAGFEIEAVAGPPLVDRPITAAFDEQGNLYVADSSGSNDKVDKQLAEKPHRIVKLIDSDHDGRFDKSTVFADKMMFPEGTMWLDGSVYIAAPPSIWKLTDTNGDGVADERVEWFQGKTLTGCANDLHGPYAGLDGWIYWCKGAFAQQTYERPGKPPFVTRASHIFRCRPDGSGIEPVMTGGMDNPVDVTFTPGGERILSNTFIIQPGGGKRDGLLHTVYGGVYGKVHDVLEGHPRTGDIMPVLSHLGPAAACGLTTLWTNQFGEGWQYNLLTCCFNQHRVTRHVLKPTGAMYESEDSDFIVSDNVDFHPTDILEDADGSVLVIDTGGWYKLCCPTSHLAKPDVLGAIYRVRRKGAPVMKDPRGNNIAGDRLPFADLAKLLADGRPVVQERAIKEFARRGTDSVKTLAGVLGHDKSMIARCNAVWALTRIDQAAARAAVREAISDQDAEVRQAALNSVSLWRDADALPYLLVALRSGTLMNQRVAAEAIGRIGQPAEVVKLLKAASYPGDRGRDHAITYALLELNDPQATAAGLKDSNPVVQKVALYAVDQLPEGKLDPQFVAGLLTSSDAGLKEAAAWVLGRHPDWGDALAGYLRSRLQLLRESDRDEDRAELETQLSQFAKTAVVQGLLAEFVASPESTRSQRLCALGAMQRSPVKELPVSWAQAVSKCVSLQRSDSTIERSMAVLRAFAPIKDAAVATEIVTALQNVADSGPTTDIRLGAIATLAAYPREWQPAQFGILLESLDPEKSVGQRSMAADVLSRSKLTQEQLQELTNYFKLAGPLEVDRLLSAYEQCSNDAVGEKLVAALKDAVSLRALRPDALKQKLAKFGPQVQQQAQALYDILNADAAKQKERLEQLLTTLKGGDVRRGQQVFYSQKAACTACHAIGYLGGNTGPDLTRIGGIRTERDLLESIVFPSLSFVRSYEPVAISTTSGKVYNGLIRKETSDEITLATGPKEEVRIPRAEIDEMNPSSLSIMPSGLDQQLTPQQLSDLIAFLKNSK